MGAMDLEADMWPAGADVEAASGVDGAIDTEADSWLAGAG
jgi:hypothetical protein